MKRIQSILFASLLTVVLASTTLAGNITTLKDGNITTAPGNITTLKDGNITTAPGFWEDIAGFWGDITGFFGNITT